MDTNTEKAITFKDVDVKLMVLHAALKTCWGFVLEVRNGVKGGTVAMDGEIRDKIDTVRKAAEIGEACVESLFEQLGQTPPLKDKNLEMQCVVTMCAIMATADKTCRKDVPAKETK